MVGLGAVISVMTSCQLCCCSTEADRDNVQMKGRDVCVPGERQIWTVDQSLLNPDLTCVNSTPEVRSQLPETTKILRQKQRNGKRECEKSVSDESIQSIGCILAQATIRSVVSSREKFANFP